MTANLKRFLDFASKNEALRARLTEINRGDPSADREKQMEGLLQAAKEFGYDLKAEDFGMGKTTGELSDEELEAVAGGNCFCWVGGGGSGMDNACVCLFNGQGTDNGIQSCDCTVLGIGIEN